MFKFLIILFSLLSINLQADIVDGKIVANSTILASDMNNRFQQVRDALVTKGIDSYVTPFAPIVAGDTVTKAIILDKFYQINFLYTAGDLTLSDTILSSELNALFDNAISSIEGGVLSYNGTYGPFVPDPSCQACDGTCSEISSLETNSCQLFFDAVLVGSSPDTNCSAENTNPTGQSPAGDQIVTTNLSEGVIDQTHSCAIGETILPTNISAVTCDTGFVEGSNFNCIKDENYLNNRFQEVRDALILKDLSENVLPFITFTNLNREDKILIIDQFYKIDFIHQTNSINLNNDTFYAELDNLFDTTIDTINASNVTYEGLYGDWSGSCEPCDGSCNQTRTLTPNTCQKYYNITTALSGAEDSDCIASENQINNSPQGDLIVTTGLPLGTDSQTYTCNEGQTTATSPITAVTCSSGYVIAPGFTCIPSFEGLYMASSGLTYLGNNQVISTYPIPYRNGFKSYPSQGYYQFNNVQEFYKVQGGFVFLKTDGTVDALGGGKAAYLDPIRDQLTNIVDIISVEDTDRDGEYYDPTFIGGITAPVNIAFAALKADGTVVTWGDQNYGGSSEVYYPFQSGQTGLFLEDISSDLFNINEIKATRGAFAALRSDGRIITWGAAHIGGFKQIFSDSNIFNTASSYINADLSTLINPSLEDSTFYEIHANIGSFLALKNLQPDGSGTAATWGRVDYGASSNEFSNIVDVVAGLDSFLLRDINGKVYFLTQPGSSSFKYEDYYTIPFDVKNSGVDEIFYDDKTYSFGLRKGSSYYSWCRYSHLTCKDFSIPDPGSFDHVGGGVYNQIAGGSVSYYQTITNVVKEDDFIALKADGSIEIVSDKGVNDPVLTQQTSNISLFRDTVFPQDDFFFDTVNNINANSITDPIIDVKYHDLGDRRWAEDDEILYHIFGALSSNGILTIWGDISDNNLNNNYNDIASILDPFFLQDANTGDWLGLPLNGINKTLVDVSCEQSQEVCGALFSDGTVKPFGRRYSVLNANYPPVQGYFDNVAKLINGSTAIRNDGFIVHWGRFANVFSYTPTNGIRDIVDMKCVVENVCVATKNDGTLLVIDGGARVSQGTEDIIEAIPPQDLISIKDIDRRLVISYEPQRSSLTISSLSANNTPNIFSTFVEKIVSNYSGVLVVRSTGRIEVEDTNYSNFGSSDYPSSIRNAIETDIVNGYNVVDAVASSAGFTVLLRNETINDGKVYSWGRSETSFNQTNLYGYETVKNQLESNGSNVIRIYANNYSFAALKANKELIVWEASTSGTLQDRISYLPQQQIFQNVENVFTTKETTWIVQSDGKVTSWGFRSALINDAVNEQLSQEPDVLNFAIECFNGVRDCSHLYSKYNIAQDI